MKVVENDETVESVERLGLAVWRCQEHSLFHMRVGDLLLTFTPTEFATFLRAAGACYSAVSEAINLDVEATGTASVKVKEDTGEAALVSSLSH